MSNHNFLESYPAHLAELQRRLQGDAAFEQAVGGEFLAVGRLEHFLLRSLGLRDAHRVVDVGCGSGRLAVQLAGSPGLGYLGTDVVPGLLEQARRLARRPDWNFELTNGRDLPAGDQTADFVCFFSVFTHLLHEDTFRYLAEAKRVSKPGGRIVFSFLEFRIPCHWDVFQQSLAHDRNVHLNQFIDRDAIQAFASHLALTVESIHDGDQPHIPLPEDVVWSDGRVMSGKGCLGQSVAVLVKA